MKILISSIFSSFLYFFFSFLFALSQRNACVPLKDYFINRPCVRCGAVADSYIPKDLCNFLAFFFSPPFLLNQFHMYTYIILY